MCSSHHKSWHGVVYLPVWWGHSRTFKFLQPLSVQNMVEEQRNCSLFVALVVRVGQFLANAPGPGAEWISHGGILLVVMVKQATFTAKDMCLISL